MVGLCGVVGDPGIDVHHLSNCIDIGPNERHETFEDDTIQVVRSTHRHHHELQPKAAADGTQIWLHGTIFGHETVQGYCPRTDWTRSNNEYLVDLYDDSGLRAITGVNGDFATCLIDADATHLHLVTDRLSSRPLYYATVDDTLLFSSRLQSIGCHPSVSPSVDQTGLAEYFGVQKAFGIRTILNEVTQVPPATVLTFSVDGSITNEWTYWQPQYQPVHRSRSTLIETFRETFSQVIAERLQADRRYGILLSGGSDSRLVLGAMRAAGHSPTTFHLTNWMSRETRTAQQVAAAAGVDFTLLKRTEDYHADLLDRVSQFSNFVGTFDESIASGFAHELQSVDTVITGYLGDTMFGTYPIFLRRVPFVDVPLPVERSISTATAYISKYLNRYSVPARIPSFLDAAPLHDTIMKNINEASDGIVHHDVSYPSLRELQLCEYYPLTNQFASANTDSIRQITGHWSPFFDNRLIDLSLTIPVKERIRTDIVNGALAYGYPTLAELPHASTGAPVSATTTFGSKIFYQIREILRRRVGARSPPEPYLNHGPWMNEAELIRHHSFIGDVLEQHADVIENIPFIDSDGVKRCYTSHLNGANHWQALYALATLLEAPVAQALRD